MDKSDRSDKIVLVALEVKPFCHFCHKALSDSTKTLFMGFTRPPARSGGKNKFYYKERENNGVSK